MIESNQAMEKLFFFSLNKLRTKYVNTKYLPETKKNSAETQLIFMLNDLKFKICLRAKEKTEKLLAFMCS